MTRSSAVSESWTFLILYETGLDVEFLQSAGNSQINVSKGVRPFSCSCRSTQAQN